MKDTFDARRRNLGEPPPPTKSRLRHRLLRAGLGLVVVAAALVGYGIWYARTHVTTVRAAVAASIVSLAADVDARLVELCVRPGEPVRAGQKVARLDDAALRAALAAAKADRAIKESLLEQARAHARLVEAEVEADIEVAKAQLEMAESRVARAEIALALRKKKVPEEIRSARASRDEALARLDYLRKGAQREEIEVARARLATARAREALRKYQVEQIQTLVERGVESPLELEVMKTELETQRNEVREAELRLEQLLAGPTTELIEEAKQRLEAREAALMLAESGEDEINSLAADLEIRRAELTAAQTALHRAEARRLEVALAQEQVKAAESELKRAVAAEQEQAALLERLTIVSPVTGTVIRTFEQVGEVCKKGVPIVLVTDDSEGRWFEGYVREDEAGLLCPGQPATVEVVVGSGNYTRAVVAAVGLSTSAIDRDNETALSSRVPSQLVWVKLYPIREIGDVRPGMSALAVIRVRGRLLPVPPHPTVGTTAHQ